MPEIKNSYIKNLSENRETPIKRILLEIGVGSVPHFYPNRLSTSQISADAFYVGLDLDRTTFKSLKGDLKSNKQIFGTDIEGDFVQADAEKLPFGDSSVDEVVIGDVLNSKILEIRLESPQKIFDEAVRVLKPYGKILILEFAGSWDYKVSEQFIKKIENDDRFVVNKNSAKDINSEADYARVYTVTKKPPK